MLMLPTAATMSATTSSSGFKGANGGGGGGGGGGSRRPSLPPMPDLSHLTEDERKLIESVIQRQRDEEEREHDMLRFVFLPFSPVTSCDRQSVQIA